MDTYPKPIEDDLSRAERRRKPDNRTSTKLVSREVYKGRKNVSHIGVKQIEKKIPKLNDDQLKAFYGSLVKERATTKDHTVYEKLQYVINTMLAEMESRNIPVEEINKIAQANHNE